MCLLIDWVDCRSLHQKSWIEPHDGGCVALAGLLWMDGAAGEAVFTPVDEAFSGGEDSLI